MTLSLVSGSASAQNSNELFGTDHIPEMRLTIRQANWAHVLDSMKISGEGMIVGAAEIDGIKYPNVGIRYRGQTSYTYEGDKNPYQIELNYIHPDQNHQGYHSFTLSNALRDPSYLREYLGFSIAGNYMDVPEANFIRLYVNNTFAGIYINIEPVDAYFLERRMGRPGLHSSNAVQIWSKMAVLKIVKRTSSAIWNMRKMRTATSIIID